MQPTLDIEDPAQLRAYLRQTGQIASDEELAITILQGGVSNRTVLVRRASGEAWVVKQALVKLRVAVDWFSSPERIHREAQALRWLSRMAPPGTITPLVFEDHDFHLLAMQAVPQPHANWKALLLAGQLDGEHVAQFGQLLGTVHREAYEQREVVADAFEDRSFFESLRLEPYYAYTARQLPAAAGFLEALIDETRRHRITLVHGDYSPKNILVYEGRLVLLDHEVAHFGDPAFDLGFSLTHLLSKAHHLAAMRDAFGRAAMDYWQVYSAAIGDVPWRGDLEARAVHHTLACLLARVAGRSPLEYMGAAARTRQRAAVLRLLHNQPRTIPELIGRFMGEL